MSILEMRDKLRAKTKEARRQIDRGEDQDKLDNLLDEIEGLRSKIERGEREDHLADLEEWGRQTADDDVPRIELDGGQSAVYPDTRSGSGAAVSHKATGNKRLYRNLFHKPENQPKESRDWDSLADFTRAVVSGRADERLQRSLQEGVPSDGGYSVPTTWRERIFDVSLQSEIIRPRAQIFGIENGYKRKIPASTIGDHSSSLYGGVSASYGEEGGTLSDNPPKLRDMQLTAHKLYMYCEASNEFLEDAVEGSEFIERTFSNALGWYYDYYFLRGSGAGQPMGILNAACTIEVSAEGGQTSGVLYENCTNMVSRLHPASFKNAVWLVHPSVLPELRK